MKYIFTILITIGFILLCIYCYPRGHGYTKKDIAALDDLILKSSLDDDWLEVLQADCIKHGKCK